MKHTLKITLFLAFIFFAAQVIGLGIVNEYIDHKTTVETGKAVFEPLPFNASRPEVEETRSFAYIFIAILVGTAIVLLLIKFGKANIWRFWFFLSVFITMTVALAAFLNQYISLFAALALTYWKIYRPNIYVHNMTELFIYGGLAAIFVPLMNLFSVFILLVLISAYDMYAVWKTKHMVKMAKWQTKVKIFAGLLVPYKLPKKIPGKVPVRKVKIKTAVLGGGDIGFPLIFAGVVMKGLMLKLPVFIGFVESLIIPVFTTIALLILLIKAEKEKFYPAMPFLSIGCIVGYLVIWLINI